VSLLTGSSLATEEVTVVIDLVAETTAAPTDAPTAAPAVSYYAFDGCSDWRQPGKGKGWKEGDSRPGYYNGTTEAAEIVCCAEEGTSCSRKGADDKCRSGHNDAVKVTWAAAKAHCEAEGMRLCASQAELDTCCGGGCQYDNQLVWSSVMEGDAGAPAATPVGECQVFPDCEGKSWCDNGVCCPGGRRGTRRCNE